MAILKARENASDTFKPVATMGVGNASQSQRGLMTAQDKVKLDTLVNLLVPVGVILTFASDINPNDIYIGTTWEKIEGRFLLGSSSDYAIGSTGGSATHSHSGGNLTALLDFNNSALYAKFDSTSSWTNSHKKLISGTQTTDTSLTDNYGTIVQGTTGSASSLPPYEVVNYWKRTA